MKKEQSKESGILYAVFTTVLLYFLFKITLIFSMQLNWHSTCLSSLWDNANSVVTPFLGFSIVAVLSCIWFFYCAIKYKQKAGSLGLRNAQPILPIVPLGNYVKQIWHTKTTAI